MSDASPVEIFALIHLTTVGISHIVAHRAWAEFFLYLRAQGQAGVIVVAFLSLGFGSIIVAFHPVWAGLPLALTLFGWAQVAKGVVYLCFPSFGLRKLEHVSLERSTMFILPGIGLLLFAGLVLAGIALR